MSVSGHSGGIRPETAAVSPDRRVRRTRMALHRALIELMQQRPYARITVQDIIDRADIGRSTFYAHYQDKDDLLLVSCMEHVRAEIKAQLARYDGDPPPLAPIEIMFRLVDAHPDVYRPLVGQRANATVLRTIRQTYAELLTEHLGPRLGPDAAPTVTFLSWGLYGLLESVMDPRDELTAEQAYRRFARLWATAGDPGEGVPVGGGDR
ncbi:TetR/AcrR family transcriptional regulator [Nocardia seriolae]|uniref:TetR family transcriptional regulator n=1 Tax=Nocardia seriolae TaxID=37332 RepID=A0ABC9YLR7_9NOCA|nr:TetR/AcrR family transcriptional regulator [Nocardia seriolae]WKY51475.1 TetR/AcrR family transcriptional regulator [Nocardia seriolae]WNJ58172.1 TetR/AcrR family transcriptional regulator [Nocardia seriolae]BEK90857.1 TetR/AcrR family transcriptional regulator [Nocardia seriolae]BEK93421.1 TetR/AcrR family transcriptional regulator [Nocardia seriolae]GAM46334.1 TetR family transcriptional regulator [Nocardia seriolae]